MGSPMAYLPMEGFHLYFKQFRWESDNICIEIRSLVYIKQRRRPVSIKHRLSYSKQKKNICLF